MDLAGGSNLAPGMYPLRLTQGDQEVTRSVGVLK